MVALNVLRSVGIPRSEEPTEVTVNTDANVDYNPGGIVLIVDDDRDTVGDLDRELSLKGYTVVSTSGITSELPRLAQALEPRAILLELLTDLDGISALRMLRNALAETPIIVYTTNQDDLDQHETQIRVLSAHPELLVLPTLADRTARIAWAAGSGVVESDLQIGN